MSDAEFNKGYSEEWGFIGWKEHRIAEEALFDLRDAIEHRVWAQLQATKRKQKDAKLLLP